MRAQPVRQLSLPSLWSMYARPMQTRDEIQASLSRSPSSSRLLSDSQHGNGDQEGLLREPLHYASIESLLEGECGLVTRLLKNALWCTRIGDGSNSTKIWLRQFEAQLF
jgi:hypothetical protein